MSKSYQILNEAVEDYNKLTALPLLVYISAQFISTTFHFYDLYSVVTSPQATLSQVGYTIMSNIWSLLINIFVMSFLISASLMASVAGKTAAILQRKLQSENLEKRRKILSTFALQLQQSQVKFSCGLFKFDWTAIPMVRTEVKVKQLKLKQFLSLLSVLRRRHHLLDYFDSI